MVQSVSWLVPWLGSPAHRLVCDLKRERDGDDFSLSELLPTSAHSAVTSERAELCKLAGDNSIPCILK